MAVGGKRGSCWCIEFIFVEIWQYFLELTSSTSIRKKLVWTRARWKYKVGLHQIWYEDYAQLTIPDTKNEDDKNAQEDSHCKKKVEEKVEGRILWRRKKIFCDAAVPEWAAAALICTGTGVGVGKSRLFTGPTLFYHFQSVISEMGPSRNDSRS